MCGMSNEEPMTREPDNTRGCNICWRYHTLPTPAEFLGRSERFTRVSCRVGSGKSEALFSRVHRSSAVYSDAEGSDGRAMLGVSRDPPQAALISILEAYEIALELKKTDCETNFGRPGGAALLRSLGKPERLWERIGAVWKSRTYALEMHGCGVKLKCEAK